MRFHTYSKFSPEMADAVDLQSLLDKLADFLLQSGFAGGKMHHPYWGEFGGDDDRSMDALREAILNALIESGQFTPEMLEALRGEGGVLGGEQSGHVIVLDGHVTGDGLAAALLLCRALEGRPLAEAASVLQRFPQAQENVRVRTKEISPWLRRELDALDGGGGDRRVLVRPSGTEPVIRVLAEAPTDYEARELCGTITALVRRELG